MQAQSAQVIAHFALGDLLVVQSHVKIVSQAENERSKMPQDRVLGSACCVDTTFERQHASRSKACATTLQQDDDSNVIASIDNAPESIVGHFDEVPAWHHCPQKRTQDFCSSRSRHRRCGVTRSRRRRGPLDATGTLWSLPSDTPSTNANMVGAVRLLLS